MDKGTANRKIIALVMEGKVAFTRHGTIRNPTAGKYPLTREQVEQCLLNGEISEGPVPDIKEAGGWKVTVTRFKADEKHEVSAVLIVEKNVLVITGYGWGKSARRRRGGTVEKSEYDDESQD